MIKCDRAEISLEGKTLDIRTEWMIICHTVFEKLYENNKEELLKDVNVAMMSEDELREEASKGFKRFFEEITEEQAEDSALPPFLQE